MIVIFRTANGWLLRHSDGGCIWTSDLTAIHTFHSIDALMAHLHKQFGTMPKRDAKGHFCSTKTDTK